MAVRITVAEYDAARKDAVKAYVEGVSVATLATGEKNEADRKSAEYFVDLGVVWTNAPESRLKSTERMRADIEFDFEAAKDGAEKAVKVLHDAQTQAASTDKDSINWTQLCAILANPLLARAEETRMKVNVGIAADGRRRLMTEDYAKTHAVQTRKLADGTVEEYTITSFGPKGDTEDVEVIIHLVPSGELLTMALADLARRKKLQAADNSVVRKLMNEARLPEFKIREARPKSSDR